MPLLTYMYGKTTSRDRLRRAQCCLIKKSADLKLVVKYKLTFTAI